MGAQAQFLLFRSKLPLHIFLSLFPKIMAKAMKAMKAMKKSVIAKGKLAKMVVFRGTKAKTGSGLKKRFDEEQEREDREPEAECEREEGLHPHQGLDRGRDQGAQVPWPQGLHRGEEGLGPLQEGEGVLWQLSSSCVLSRQGMMIALL